jgi:hypothetical protein
MRKCDLCGNDYDKSFEIHINGDRHTFEALNVQSTSSRQRVAIAAVASSATVSKLRGRCSAVHTARGSGVTDVTDRT